MSSTSSGRPEAAAEVWDWRRERSSSGDASTPSRARIRGSIQAAVGVAVAVLIFFFWSPMIAYVVSGFATLLFIAALASPTSLYPGFQRFFELTERLVGGVLTWMIMVLLFYLFFLPFGLLFRRGKKDRLKRHRDAEATTYWETCDGRTASPESAERLY